MWLFVAWTRNLVFLLKCQVLSASARPDCKWYTFTKVLDSNLSNYRDLVDDIVNEFLPGYGNVVKLFYYCAKSRSHPQVTCDQDMVAMFANYIDSKLIRMFICYEAPTCDYVPLPEWNSPEKSSGKKICTS